MEWEVLAQEPTFQLRRSGRFLVAELIGEHHVVSTSVRHGGQTSHVRCLLNHQSCEGAAHLARHDVITESGPGVYHERACEEAGVDPEHTAMMGTAANMNYVAVVREADEDVVVTAAVTAGVEGNATAAGEHAAWRETQAGVEKVPVYAGTINVMLLINRPVTSGALARSIMTMTEGKSAALQRLAVPSKRGADLATGTGTDQFCIAAPWEKTGRIVLTSASPHMKLGELIGRAVRDAVIEALRWQNGLEASYTRGIFHALGRYGVREATIFDDIAPLLSEGDLELLKRNAKSVFYEPLAGSAAHALAGICDRARFGMLPPAAAADAMAQQAACLAASLAAQVHRWPEFRTKLHLHAGSDVKTLVLNAVALGWSEKWRTP